jgi:hypothetical protein
MPPSCPMPPTVSRAGIAAQVLSVALARFFPCPQSPPPTRSPRRLPGHDPRRPTMVVIEGPGFSTRTESQWYAAQGWSLVNMTGHPEAVLARELAMCYPAVALVTDRDAGRAIVTPSTRPRCSPRSGATSVGCARTWPGSWRPCPPGGRGATAPAPWTASLCRSSCPEVLLRAGRPGCSSSTEAGRFSRAVVHVGLLLSTATSTAARRGCDTRSSGPG